MGGSGLSFPCTLEVRYISSPKRSRWHTQLSLSCLSAAPVNFTCELHLFFACFWLCGAFPAASVFLQLHQKQGLQWSCSSQALEHRLPGGGARASVLQGKWDLPRPGTDPMSPDTERILYHGATREAQHLLSLTLTSEHTFILRRQDLGNKLTVRLSHSPS